MYSSVGMKTQNAFVMTFANAIVVCDLVHICYHSKLRVVCAFVSIQSRKKRQTLSHTHIFLYIPFRYFQCRMIASCMRIQHFVCIYTYILQHSYTAVCSFSFCYNILYCSALVHLSYHRIANLSYSRCVLPLLQHCTNTHTHRCLFISCNVLHPFSMHIQTYTHTHIQYTLNDMKPHEVEWKVNDAADTNPRKVLLLVGWYGCWHKQTSYHRPVYYTLLNIKFSRH